MYVCVCVCVYRYMCVCVCVCTHYTQQISKAAVVKDSKAILKCIISRKKKACSCTSSTTGAAYVASGACLRARFARTLPSRLPYGVA